MRPRGSSLFPYTTLFRSVNTRNRRRVAETVLDATRLVGRPIFFSLAIIILAFLPVFALTGQEGKLFHPLAYTKTFAMRSEEHTSELQPHSDLVCRLLLAK